MLKTDHGLLHVVLSKEFETSKRGVGAVCAREGTRDYLFTLRITK